MRNTVLEVSRDAFLKNYESIKKYIGNKAKIMPVVKANCYGTYLNKDSELMNKFEIVAVAIVDEAVKLREYGYKNDIFVLNQPYIDEIDTIINNNIIIGLSSLEFLREVISLNKRPRVHLELETGMNRTGIISDYLDEFLNVLKDSSIDVEGVYTHFSSADIDDYFTYKQVELFNDGVKKIKEFYPNIKCIHSSASNGLLNFDLGITNMVRPGIILYGYPSSKTCISKIDLYPVCKFRSKISFIKEINIGDGVSYGRSFVASNNIKVATVGCGYADGVKRELSNKGYVSINGKRCKIIGRVCMDSFMVDVSDLDDVKIGDDVYIFDNELVTLEEVAIDSDTINYEILSTIGERVPRVYVD